MCKIKEFFSDMSEMITVSKMDGVLIVTVGVLAGVIVGMLCSPRKNSRFGCGNGTTTIHNWKEDGEAYEDDNEEECIPF